MIPCGGIEWGEAKDVNLWDIRGYYVIEGWLKGLNAGIWGFRVVSKGGIGFRGKLVGVMVIVT